MKASPDQITNTHSLEQWGQRKFLAQSPEINLLHL